MRRHLGVRPRRSPRRPQYRHRRGRPRSWTVARNLPPPGYALRRRGSTYVGRGGRAVGRYGGRYGLSCAPAVGCIESHGCGYRAGRSTPASRRNANRPAWSEYYIRAPANRPSRTKLRARVVVSKRCPRRSTARHVYSTTTVLPRDVPELGHPSADRPGWQTSGVVEGARRLAWPAPTDTAGPHSGTRPSPTFVNMPAHRSPGEVRQRRVPRRHGRSSTAYWVGAPTQSASDIDILITVGSGSG